jgi:hypothetical protein
VASIAAAKAAGRSTWRVSSTVFSHIASDQLLQPLAHFAQQPGAAERYPPTPAGLQVGWCLNLKGGCAFITQGRGDDFVTASFPGCQAYRWR